MEQDNVSVVSIETEIESDIFSIASEDTFYQDEIENDDEEYNNARERFYNQEPENEPRDDPWYWDDEYDILYGF